MDLTGHSEVTAEPLAIETNSGRPTVGRDAAGGARSWRSAAARLRSSVGAKKRDSVTDGQVPASVLTVGQSFCGEKNAKVTEFVIDSQHVRV